MSQREHILMLILGVFLILLLLCLSGCTATKQTKYQVRYTKGCAIDVSVVTAESAQRIMKVVDLKDCEAESHVDDTSKPPNLTKE